MAKAAVLMFTMRFEGGEDLARRFDQLPQALTRTILLAALKAAAEPMRARAAALAPRSASAKSHMADHIVIQAVNRIGSVQGGRWKERLGEAWVAVGPAKPFFYGIFQEYGTKHHSAHPFLRPAFDTQAPAALPILSTHLWAALRKQLPTSFAAPTVSNREVFPMAA